MIRGEARAAIVKARAAAKAAYKRELRALVAERAGRTYTPRERSLSATKPWEREGVSRATYYRELAAARETISDPVAAASDPAVETVSDPLVETVSDPACVYHTALSPSTAPVTNTSTGAQGGKVGQDTRAAASRLARAPPPPTRMEEQPPPYTPVEVPPPPPHSPLGAPTVATTPWRGKHSPEGLAYLQSKGRIGPDPTSPTSETAAVRQVRLPNHGCFICAHRGGGGNEREKRKELVVLADTAKRFLGTPIILRPLLLPPPAALPTLTH